jgi:hypothetical protein
LPLTFARRPVGSFSDTASIALSRSGLVMCNANGENAPPVGLTVPAVNTGANPPRPAVQSTVKSDVRLTVWPPHELSSTSTVFVPQVGGVASGARGPSLSCSAMFDTGSSGLLSNVVTSRPVFLSARTWPGRRTEMPRALSSNTSARRNNSPDSGSSEF